MKKKIIFYNFIIFLIFFFIFDIIVSNFFLKITNTKCYKIEKQFYELKKNCVGRQQFKSSFPVIKITTNEMGLRSNKIGKRFLKDNNILIFGDSFTFGVGIEYENTYVGLLEKRLKDYSFYNFGVGSYSPSMHLYRLEEAIKNNLMPKKIILFLDLTDIYDEGKRWKNKNNSLKPSLSYNQIETSQVKRKFKHKNLQISVMLASKINYNLRILRNRIGKSINKKNKSEKVKTSFQGSFTYTPIKNLNKVFWTEEIFYKGIDKIKDKIKRISNIAKNNDSEFFLVIYPWSETLVYGQKSFNWEKFGKNLCSEFDCNLINTFNEFREEKDNNVNWYSDLYFIGDEHFNDGGNLFMADILQDKIFKRNWKFYTNHIKETYINMK